MASDPVFLVGKTGRGSSILGGTDDPRPQIILVGPSAGIAGHRRDGRADGRPAALAGARSGSFQFRLEIRSLGIALGSLDIPHPGTGDFTLQHLVLRDVVKTRERPQAIQSDVTVNGRPSGRSGRRALLVLVEFARAGPDRLRPRRMVVDRNLRGDSLLQQRHLGNFPQGDSRHGRIPGLKGSTPLNWSDPFELVTAQ
jgi:hypothetical protein